MVHGTSIAHRWPLLRSSIALRSDPRIWSQLSNLAVLLCHRAFLVLANARHALRESLDKTVGTLDPAGPRRGLCNERISSRSGHSMGGAISHALVSSSGRSRCLEGVFPRSLPLS